MTHNHEHHDHSHEHSDSHSHPHDHNHEHEHDHHHSHSHENSHSHSHTHSHELSFEQKLEKLFSHWIDHNNSHKETFMTWAQRAKEANLTAVAENIEKAAQMSEELTKSLQEGLKTLNS